MSGRHRGLTFIEVALAVALLAGLASVIATSYDTIARLNTREQDRLFATEVAHRLILNYLLDPTSLPSEGERIPYSSDYFFEHELTEEMLIEDQSEAARSGSRRTGRADRGARSSGAADAREASVMNLRPVSAKQLSQNERLGAGLKMVTIRVYRPRQFGEPRERTPLATLSRIYSPISQSQDENVLIRQVQELLGQNIEIPSTPPGGR